MRAGRARQTPRAALCRVLPSASGFSGGLDGKAFAYNAGDLGSIPRLGRSPGEGNGNPLHYSRLGNPMHRGAWWAAVLGVAKELDTAATKQQQHSLQSVHIISSVCTDPTIVPGGRYYDPRFAE